MIPCIPLNMTLCLMPCFHRPHTTGLASHTSRIPTTLPGTAPYLIRTWSLLLRLLSFQLNLIMTTTVVPSPLSQSLLPSTVTFTMSIHPIRVTTPAMSTNMMASQHIMLLLNLNTLCPCRPLHCLATILFPASFLRPRLLHILRARQCTNRDVADLPWSTATHLLTLSPHRSKVLNLVLSRHTLFVGPAICRDPSPLLPCLILDRCIIVQHQVRLSDLRHTQRLSRHPKSPVRPARCQFWRAIISFPTLISANTSPMPT